MKYNVKIGEKTFEVEIDDLNKRPVIARVDGEVFEVSPEITNKAAVRPEGLPAGDAKPVAPAASSASLSGNAMLSPLPGTVIEVFVKPGDEVESGATLLIIEAMKMKNNIRSVRAGKVAKVLVTAGSTVGHKHPLVEFES
jgi:biotin carboxyl carrier protein